MCLNEDEQHQDRKPLVTDDKNNRRNQHVMHSSRKYQCDVHTEQINARQGVNDDINKNGYQQLEGEKNNSSRNTDDINKMMCNLLLHQSAHDVEIDTFKRDPMEYHYFMSALQKPWRRKLVIHMVDWFIFLSLQKDKQKKPSNMVFSNHQKRDMQELKYCWNNIMGLHKGYSLLTIEKSKLGHY